MNVRTIANVCVWGLYYSLMFHGLKYVSGLGKFNLLCKFFFFSFERDEDGNDAKGNLINYNLG